MAELTKTTARFYISDMILGGQDGLVNVLGVILGVAAASNDPRLIVAAGLAATFAESISMGAVAYTSTTSDADYYRSEEVRVRKLIDTAADQEKKNIEQIYRTKGFEGPLLDQVVEKITSNKDIWLTTMINEGLGLEAVDRSTAVRSAVLVGFSALAGSFVPLIPYFFIHDPAKLTTAGIWAVVLSGLTLFAVGAYKAQKTIGHPVKSGTQIAVIGLVSALVGYLVGVIFQAPAI